MLRQYLSAEFWRKYVRDNLDGLCAMWRGTTCVTTTMTAAPWRLLPCCMSNQDIQIHTIGVKSKFAIKAKSADLSSCPGHGVMESRCWGIKCSLGPCLHTIKHLAGGCVCVCVWERDKENSHDWAKKGVQRWWRDKLVCNKKDPALNGGLHVMMSAGFPAPCLLGGQTLRFCKVPRDSLDCVRHYKNIIEVTRLLSSTGTQLMTP